MFILKKQSITIEQLYLLLARYLGIQNWWPAASVPEMLCGMILVQNTSWNSAARSLANLMRATCFDIGALRALKKQTLEKLIKPSGFQHAKAKYLYNILTMYQDHFSELCQLSTKALRKTLLQVSGIGNETADVLLLYLFERSTFAADKYTRNLFFKLTGNKHSYTSLKRLVENNTNFSTFDAQEFHALLDEYGKLKNDPLHICKKYILQTSHS